MRICGMILIAGIFLAPSLFAQDETTLESKIESIGLFKNGLGYVKETVSIKAPGKYVISNVPEPVHGTFWIESDAEIVVKVVSRLAKVPVKDSGRTFQDLFAGRKVSIFFGKEGMPPQTLKGTICPREILKPGGNWSHDYDAGSAYYGYYNYRPSQPTPVDNNPLGGRFLKVKTDTGTTYLDSSLIAYIESDGENETTDLLKPVLVLDVKKVPAAPANVSISYLTRGIAWAPSYKIELTGTDTLKITQKAIVKNEFAKFADTELNLISGFPNVKFAYVTSPLSPRTSWASFFQQLNRRNYGGDNNVMTNSVVSQQSISRGPSGNDGLDLSPEGETADIYYNSIGRFTMDEGDAIALDVASEKASYDELVEWIIPDNRNPNGRQVQEYEIQQNPEKYQQSAWDAMKFRNPFKFPMTTASAMISSSGKFLGETVSSWVNPGQETVLHITKALSISTNASEREVEGKREIVYVGGHDFRKSSAEGVLTVKNLRKKNVKLQVKKRFSGDLKSAEGAPKCELREEGLYSVNKSNELIWDFELKPGEEKTLKYQYEVLVNN